jgi:hypothetical protein
MGIASSSSDSTQIIKFYVQNNTLFIGKKQICSIEIPSDVLFLSFGCFADCKNLEQINLPEGITDLPPLCFTGCTSLIQVILPSTLRRIRRGGLYNGCFSNCSSLD